MVPSLVKRAAKILEAMRRDAQGIRFSDLSAVCDAYFGAPRQSNSSHRVYPMPWLGDPRVNIQESKGLAKAYQVKQVLQAIDKLGGEHENKT